MTETVWIAIIAATSAAISPAILALLNYFTNRATKREDYRRQDIVAAQAREVATVLASTNAVTAQKLDAVHALVNSNYSEIMQTLLDSLIAQLVLMEKDKARPSDIEAIRTRINLLREALIERGRAADIITAKAKAKAKAEAEE